jgi:PAS domain S-box-containing protein
VFATICSGLTAVGFIYAPIETPVWVVLTARFGEISILWGMVIFLMRLQRAEEAARASEERFQLVARATKGAVWDWNLITDRVWWNEGLITLFGYQASQVVPTSGWWHSHIHQEDQERVVSSIHKAIEGGGHSWLDEFRFRQADGGYAHILARGYLIRHPSGKPVRMLGAMLDITARKQAEEQQRRLLHNVGERVKELTALHRAVRLLQDSAKPPSEVFTQIVALLPPAWQYPEIAAARIVSDSMEYTTPNFSDTQWKQSADVVTSQGKQGVIEVVYLRERPNEVEGPFLAEERNLINSLADSLSSYLNRKQTEAALRGAHERLQALSQQLMQVQEQERRQLARDLHDEIGQALTAVKMNLQTLQRCGDVSGITPSLGDSLNIIDRMLQHVRDLSLDLRPSLLDDLGLVSAVRWYVARQAERAGWTADVVADDSLLCLPAETAVPCYRVVQEALTNVMRHAQASRVNVSLRQHDRELEILVHDDGVGFNVQEALAHAAQGQSLGLLGMEERIRFLDGHVTIDSRPGYGTEVRARIPLRPAMAAGRSADARAT